MKSFQVLDRKTEIAKNYLLEASAGTGKTFSIENIIIRLLIEGEGIPLNKLLVVTFTKLATNDLKNRIRTSIEKSLSALSGDKIPSVDYLNAIIEGGETSISKAKKNLRNALASFDEAQIFTIHSFCMKMLSESDFEGNFSISNKSDAAISDYELSQVIRDFLRTKLTSDRYSPGAIEELQKKIELESELLKIVKEGSAISLPLEPCENNKSACLLLKIAAECKEMVQKYLEEEEKWCYQDLLNRMLKALRHPAFLKKMRNRFQAAIIDEFQDTDPLQWDIFRTIFLDKSTSCLLYLVGDPKQSIYAFRNADIYTYMEAAAKIGQDNHASLNMNYRSHPPLVEALNRLFSASPGLLDLPRLKKDMPYPPVSPSPSIEIKSFKDRLGAIHFFSAEGAIKSGKPPFNMMEKEFFFPFILQEIIRLNQEEKIPLKNMAVLAKDHQQIAQFSAFCKENNLPVLVQKREPLFKTAAFKATKELIEACINGKNLNLIKIALAGPLFGWTIKRISHLDEPTNLEQVLREFRLFKAILDEEGYISLFQHVMRMQWHENNESVIENILSRTDGDLLFQDFEQLAGLIAEQQAAFNLDSEALLIFLEEFPKGKEEDDPKGKRLFDPSADAIQVLTMHTSKGLEYDIVFALGLMRRSPKQNSLYYPKKEEERTALAPVIPESLDYQLYLDEMDAEKMRQFYVVMTRAKYRVYVPVPYFSNLKSIEAGTASPLELYLARLEKPLEKDYRKLYERIQEFKLEFLADFVRQNQEYMSYSAVENTQPSPFLASKSKQVLSPPREVFIPGRAQMMLSYTSLAKFSETHVPHGTDERNIPHDVDNPEKNPHTLPSGASTGIVLHKILESIPLDCCRSMASYLELMPFVRSYVNRSEWEPWLEPLAEIIFNALTVPLKPGDSSFSISDIDPKRTYREMEFLYPVSNGYMKGVIDLIFEHGGQYYIVDWKSNWLGKDCSSYSKAALNIAMEQNQYILQLELYQEALKRYLSLADPKAPFGGAFYVFLRGLNPKDTSQGVWRS